jgi:hypothetical protein
MKGKKGYKARMKITSIENIVDVSIEIRNGIHCRRSNSVS